MTHLRATLRVLQDSVGPAGYFVPILSLRIGYVVSKNSLMSTCRKRNPEIPVTYSGSHKLVSVRTGVK